MIVGILCGQCTDRYAVTLDLLQCTPSDNQCAGGLSVFIILCGAVVVLCFLILIFNVELPNELKGFVFYAQVATVMYLGRYVSLKIFAVVFFCCQGCRIALSLA